MIPHDEHPVHRTWHLMVHMVKDGAVLFPLGVVSLGMGMAVYHWVEGLSWSDAFLNAAMLLGGMGPINPIHTELGKWLVGAYALFAGVIFLILAGVMLAPVMHHVLHAFHLERDRATRA
jgi:hypothetical protein